MSVQESVVPTSFEQAVVEIEEGQVADAMLVKVRPTIENIRLMAQDLQDAGAPYVMMIAGVCGRVDGEAAGVAMALMMPAIFTPDGSRRAA
jgi:hypothetical protein